MEQIVFVFPWEDSDAFIWVISQSNFDNDMRLCVCARMCQKKESKELKRITEEGNEKGEIDAENSRGWGIQWET